MIKIAVTLINLIIAALFFTLVYSAANIDVSFNLDTKKVNVISFGNGTIEMRVPVKIRNGGLYPIENVNINIEAYNGTNRIYSNLFSIGDIAPLSEYVKDIRICINLLEMYKKLGNYYLFNGGTIALKIRVSANYWKMADFNALYLRNLTMSPLIYRFTVYTDHIRFEDGYAIVPYFISKVPMAINAKIYAVVRDIFGIIGTTEDNITFDRLAYMRIRLYGGGDYLLTNDDIWTISLQINIDDIIITKTVKYRWISPIKGLGIEKKVENGIIKTYLVLSNGWNREISINVSYVVNAPYGSYSRSSILSIPSGGNAEIELFNVVSGYYKVIIKIVVMCIGISRIIVYTMEV